MLLYLPVPMFFEARNCAAHHFLSTNVACIVAKQMPSSLQTINKKRIVWKRLQYCCCGGWAVQESASLVLQTRCTSQLWELTSERIHRLYNKNISHSKNSWSQNELNSTLVFKVLSAYRPAYFTTARSQVKACGSQTDADVMKTAQVCQHQWRQMKG